MTDPVKTLTDLHTKPSELTPLQQLERKAMAGDRAALIHVVSALRGYRAAAALLIERRYDGSGDVIGMHANEFKETIEAIEQNAG